MQRISLVGNSPEAHFRILRSGHNFFLLDVITSNINDRPIYFSVSCRPEKMFGLNPFPRMEGLGLRIVPVFNGNEETRLYGEMYGAGKVYTDKVYDNVMNKFRWGNFDKVETHVNTSYGPSIQSLHFVMLRTITNLVAEGKKEMAMNMCHKYFEVFPQMNFEYNYYQVAIADQMVRLGEYAAAKPYLEAVAEETIDNLDFFRATGIIEAAEVNSQADYMIRRGELTEAGFTRMEDYGFSRDVLLAQKTLNDIITSVKSSGQDDEYASELEGILSNNAQLNQ